MRIFGPLHNTKHQFLIQSYMFVHGKIKISFSEIAVLVQFSKWQSELTYDFCAVLLQNIGL